MGFGGSRVHFDKSTLQTWSQTTKQAQTIQSTAEKYIAALCEELEIDYHASVIRRPPKQLNRAWEKAIQKHDGDLTKIGDICAYRILFDGPQDVINLRKIFIPGKKTHPFHQEWGPDKDKKRHVDVREFQDNFVEPSETGYMGIHVRVEATDNAGRAYPVEIQFMHKGMQNTDIESHLIYENIRSIKATAKKEGRALTEQEQFLLNEHTKRNQRLYLLAAAEHDLLDLMKNRLPRNWRQNLEAQQEPLAATTELQLVPAVA